jgi:hypothetical protein
LRGRKEEGEEGREKSLPEGEEKTTAILFYKEEKNNTPSSPSLRGRKDPLFF